MERSPFYRHLRAAGGISRSNPELARLADKTGFSLEHLFKVATGRRQASLPLAKAVALHSRNSEVTPESILQGPWVK